MIAFTKMSGAGNDFVVFDNRSGEIQGDVAELVRRLCTRGLSVGADGVILAERSRTCDVRMAYFNADGGRASFCANGTRCLARFAVLKGFVKGPQVVIETDVGTVEATVNPDGQVTVPVPGPYSVEPRRQLFIDALALDGSYVVVGVPHYVLPVKNLWIEGIEGLGSKVRFHPDLAPEGANVDFVTVRTPSLVQIRTYERGVERETLSCGSGCVAAALALARRELVTSPVVLQTRSGIDLKVAWSMVGSEPSSVCLTGDARVVFQGFLEQEAVSGFDPALRQS